MHAAVIDRLSERPVKHLSKALLRGRGIAVFGAGSEGERLIRCAEAAGIAVVAVVDDNPTLWGHLVAGHEVHCRYRLNQFEHVPPRTPVIIASHRAEDIAAWLPGRCVWPFAHLQVRWPLAFPPHPFVVGWREERAHIKKSARYAWLRSELADDASRDVLDAVLHYRRTQEPLSFARVRTSDLYEPAILPWGAEEVVVDAGAYRGDTIDLWQRRGVKHIHAFEPEPENYRALVKHCAERPGITCYHGGLWSREGRLLLCGKERYGELSTSEGDARVIALDSLRLQPTFIKMNIEGAEVAALRGARKTIRRYQPNLAISVYHRVDHLWRIPCLIHSLSPSYRLYLRQHEGGCVETVLYAISSRE